jgi:RND family efflux transporter MFP subunit
MSAMKIAIGLFVVVFASTLVVLKMRHGSTNSKTHAPPAEVLRGTPAVSPPADADPAFTGVILAGDSVQIEANTSGRIEQLFVKPGDEVARGASIAQLDVRGMKSELAVAQASAAEASARFSRRLGLSKGGVAAITPEELDNAKFDAVRAQAQVAGLARSVAEAKVVAPFPGTVTEQYIGKGALAGPGRFIVRLLGKGTPRVRFAVPELRAHTIAPNTLVSIEAPGNSTKATGTVVSITSEVDNASGMVYAVATVHPMQSDNAFARGGLVVRVRPTAQEPAHSP